MNLLSGTDYESLSGGETSDEGSGSEDEREALEANRKRALEAEKAMEAHRREKEGSSGRKRRSVVVVSDLRASASTVSSRQETQDQPPKRRKEKESDPLAIAEAMGRSMIHEMASMQGTGYKIPKKAKPSADEEEAWEEEDTIMVEETVELKDNSVDILDLETRAKMRVPNAAADSWWTKAWTSQRMTHPVRGASLFLENLQGANRPNDDIIMKFHDRCTAFKLLHFASKNADVSDDSSTVTHSKGKTWVMKKDWMKLDNMEEVVDAVENWTSICFMTRWQSHEALAFRRVMTDLRWLSGLGRDEKEQVSWVEETANSVLSANVQRAGQGRPPMVYEEIRKKVVAKMTQKGKSESLVFSSTGLYSSRSKKEADLEKKVENLQKELKVLKEKKPVVTPTGQPRGGGRGRGGRGGSAYGSVRQTPSLEQKIAWTCPDFNSSAGCKDPCPKSLRHQCNHTQGKAEIMRIMMKTQLTFKDYAQKASCVQIMGVPRMTCFVTGTYICWEPHSQAEHAMKASRK